MQFSPALPWAAGTRGTITLRNAVNNSDLANGSLTFISGTGYIYQPEINDGYVDYYYMRDEQRVIAFSIRIEDDPVSELEVSVPQDDNISEILQSNPVGFVEYIDLMDENLNEVALGQEGFLIAHCRLETSGEPETVFAALTQDGITVMKGVSVDTTPPLVRVMHRSIPVSVTSLLKLSSAQATGAVAQLQKLQAVLYSYDTQACIRALHAPSEDEIEGAAGLMLMDNNAGSIEWGSEVTDLYVQV